MTIKRILSELGGFVGRGFRYERYDFSDMGKTKDLLDFCAVLRIHPVGFSWSKIRLVIGGPVSAAGTLDLFSRRVRKESAVRYTVSGEFQPSNDEGVVFCALPMAGATASIGIVGIYFTGTDGREHSYITRSGVKVSRGKILDIGVPMVETAEGK